MRRWAVRLLVDRSLPAGCLGRAAPVAAEEAAAGPTSAGTASAAPRRRIRR